MRSENKIVDALSIISHTKEGQILTLESSIQPLWMKQLINSYEGDQLATDLITQLPIDAQACPGYYLKNGLLYDKEQLFIGSTGSLRDHLLSLYHSSCLGGHFGVYASYIRPKRHFF